MFQQAQQGRMFCAVAALLVLASGTVAAAPKAPGSKGSWSTSAVGTKTVNGSATTSPSGRITVSGEGTDIWSTADGFQFVYQRLSGDRQIVAKITALQETNGWAKAGLMIRQGLTAGSVHASLLATPSNGIVFEHRTATGGTTALASATGAAPMWLRLTRTGQSMTASVSDDGAVWTDIGKQDVSMIADVYVGLAVTSHSPSRLTTASFERVALTVPAADAAPPPSGPVAAWSFDDGIGTLARASIGGLDGAITGATWTTAGKYRGALAFNGVDSVVSVSAAAALNLTTGMTVEGWVYPTELTNLRSVAVKEGSNDLAYGLYATNASAKPEGIINTGAGPLTACGVGTLPLNAWSHLATTFDGTTQRLFVNGVQVASSSAGGTLTQTSGAFRIGGNKIWGEWFSGVIDDMRLYDRALSATEIQTDMNTAVAPPAADTTSPTVAISTPVNSATVSGTVSIVANASDDTGVASVQFLLDGVNLGAALTEAPYATTWNTTSATNALHHLTAVARDLAGNANVSQDVSVTVNNPDTTSPTVAISSPVNSATVSGTVSVVATASDDTGVVSVQFLLDGVNFGAALTAAPYATTWNTTSATNGLHRLTAVARDLAGNTNVSQGVSVTVNNADTTSPNVAISSPASGSVLSGSVTVTATATDNVGVASVQFLLNGVNLGAAVTASPYRVVWNTGSTPNGIYRLVALARDAAGNQSVSADVTVTVSNASPFVVGRTVQFTSPDHFATLSDGSATVSSYTLEVWVPGSNTSTGQPYRTSPLGKPSSTTTTLTVDQQTFFNGLPKGQEYFTTVTATGPGGSARSTASNSFMMQ